MKWLAILSLIFFGVGCSDGPPARIPDSKEGWTEEELVVEEAASAEPDFKRAVIPSGTPFDDLSFEIPVEWEIEWVPSIESLNAYMISGTGNARERSQVFIRYFDANQFLTLSTVDIYTTLHGTVGVAAYEARTYDIEKKSGLPNFVDQPSWRNERHLVTDFRASDGFTRYYVVAANPDLETNIYQQVLASMKISE